MINSKTLGSAAGIQRQEVINNSNHANLATMCSAVIVGRFRRGRVGKGFFVTAENYQAVLGDDPHNDSYSVVEDAFSRGANQIYIVRLGDSARAAGIPSIDTNALFTLDGTRMLNGTSYIL